MSSRVGLPLQAVVLSFALLASSAASVARAWHVLPPGEGAWRAAERPGIRGITVGPIESSQLPGRGYGSAYSEALLDELARLGANWVSITPFGRMWSLASTTIQRDFEQPYDENRRAVTRMIAQAHARGLKVLLIPHLWVETGGWRGEIDPGSPERWAAYQAAYRAFVLEWAALAGTAGADAFSIGVECKSWSGRFPEVWRSLIGAVRARFQGPLTYSANWDEVEQVVFWDQLDVIGVNAFYPLAQHPAARYDEYLLGAMRARDGLARMARALAMPVLFVEAGYTTRADAAVEPWLWPDDMTDVAYDEDEQARALAALLEVFAPESWFVGLFIWRYYADLDDVSQEHTFGFSPHGKRAERVLEQAFHFRWAVDPTTKY